MKLFNFLKRKPKATVVLVKNPRNSEYDMVINRSKTFQSPLRLNAWLTQQTGVQHDIIQVFRVTSKQADQILESNKNIPRVTVPQQSSENTGTPEEKNGKSKGKKGSPKKPGLE